MAPHRCQSKVAMLAIALISTALLLNGCGSGGGGETTATTTPTIPPTTKTTTVTTTKLPYYCKTSLFFDDDAKSMPIKGMAVDDATLSECSDKLMGVWPNTKSEKVKSLRLFAAWKSAWGDDDTKREQTWAHLLSFVKDNDAKVFMGVDSTWEGFANGENEKQWQWGLDLMKRLGKERVMGFSFGNEMLNKHGAIDWDGTMWPWVQKCIGEMDAAGFEDTNVTFVWSMGIFPRIVHGSFPFLDKIVTAYPKRWVWAANPYSIWDRSQFPTSASDCQAKANGATSITYLRNIVTALRKQISSYTGNTNDPLWIGETGWSSPGCQGSLSFCAAWSSKDALRNYYQNFLEWDGSLNDGLKAPDHLFYFTYRDSSNFGAVEHFGLVDTCSNPYCKLQKTENQTHHVVV